MMAKRSWKAAGTEAKVRAVMADAQIAASAQYDREVGYAFQFCESPIERLFIAQMLHPDIADEFSTRIEIMRRVNGAYKNCTPPPVAGIYVYPQVQGSRYRVDFLLIGQWIGRDAAIVVEVDGHDFHQKSKEQVARDKKRDRWFTARGLPVIRYTGSEVHADAAKVVFDALHILEGLAA